MKKLAIVKVGNEITGVYLSPRIETIDGEKEIEVEIIDFKKMLSPWGEKTLEQIEQSKLVRIA